MLFVSDKIGKNYEFLSIFSRDRRYRFVLERTWDEKKPKLCFITLNPETSDTYHWDSTLLVCKEFAMIFEDGSYGGVCMLNLYPYITHKTTDLLEYDGEMFEKNLEYIQYCVNKSKKVFCAWGDNVFRRAGKIKIHNDYATQLWKKIQNYRDKIYCFGLLKSSHPCHIVPKDGGILLSRFLNDLQNGTLLEECHYKGLKESL
ncbi:DUF1643 domain-containing protein [Helicobacter cappadocius]|uniref:DUF1643 domain-containing protein n=1 Tax=Helicobacter cappadocius TaxID=3063998 RepID=A0AA90Q1I4_9HELI|nr:MULTISPECIES: DUF1643 domain-containing protein [unclassified Helicobacter]MDO7252601.1 DUF1643 domain-containing protein [Helicobacter sp. faydin-H75]MDP2538468.1 DUF1643 domain-containing protein [Helicobacter sp. faydin-H76]